MLLTQRALARQKKDKSLFPHPERLVKVSCNVLQMCPFYEERNIIELTSNAFCLFVWQVKKSMARLKLVLRERELVVKAAKEKVLFVIVIVF
jgi:hypothetical protein